MLAEKAAILSKLKRFFNVSSWLFVSHSYKHNKLLTIFNPLHKEWLSIVVVTKVTVRVVGDNWGLGSGVRFGIWCYGLGIVGDRINLMTET